MKPKQLIILGVVLVALIFLYSFSGNDENTGSKSGLQAGDVIINSETLNVNDVTSLKISDTDDSVHLSRQEGSWFVSNRDNYIIQGKTDREFRILKAYLSTRLVLFLFSTTRYRMKYLEKYIFEMIPDISNDTDVEPEQINEKWISDYFGLEEIERLVIKNHSTRHYLPFP